MSAKLFTTEDANNAKIQLVLDDKGSQAVHDLIVAYQANRRTGSANTKTRGEVSGNNKKIFRQKGTGNARHGDKRAPIFVGGGVVFGPRPRDYSKKVNKKTRKLALRRILGDAVTAGKIYTIPALSIADGKTKTFVSTIKAIVDAPRTLIIAKDFDEMTIRASNNVPNIILMSDLEVNIEHIMNARAIIIVEDAYACLANRTA